MLKVDYLSNVINYFENSGAWFFMNLKCDKIDYKIMPKDLLGLPPNCLIKMRDFVSRYTLEELEEMDAKSFIQDSTGENLDKIVKLLKVEKKKQSLEQDFV